MTPLAARVVAVDCLELGLPTRGTSMAVTTGVVIVLVLVLVIVMLVVAVGVVILVLVLVILVVLVLVLVVLVLILVILVVLVLILIILIILILILVVLVVSVFVTVLALTFGAVGPTRVTGSWGCLQTGVDGVTQLANHQLGGCWGDFVCGRCDGNAMPFNFSFSPANRSEQMRRKK